MVLPVSVFIIAKDEEQRIGRTIAAVVDWVDEVIVVDSGSTDSTVEICKSLGAKTFHNDWAGYGAQNGLLKTSVQTIGGSIWTRTKSSRQN